MRDSNKINSLWKLPVVLAFIIQAASFVILWGLLYFLGRFFHVEVTLGVATLLQATLATLLSYLFRLPKWWLIIQFCFPLALLVGLALKIPSWFFLVGFLALLAVFGSLIKTRVPLFLSGENTWKQVATLLPEARQLRFADVGSGLGGLLFYLERERPHISLTGIELSPVPWVISRVRAFKNRSHIKLMFGDYEKLDFSEFDVVFAFLSPVVMESLWSKVADEMSRGGLLLSLAFPIPDKKPDFVIQAEKERAVIYGYHVMSVV